MPLPLSLRLREPLPQTLDRLQLAQPQRHLLLREKHAALVAVACAREFRDRRGLRAGVLMSSLQVMSREGAAARREGAQDRCRRLEPLRGGGAIRLAAGQYLLRAQEVPSRLLQEDTAMPLERSQR